MVQWKKKGVFRKMFYNSEKNSACYFPPMVGNGDVFISVDKEGVTNYLESDFPEMKAYGGYIYREGRRMAHLPNTVPGKLISQGRLFYEHGAKVEGFTQDLDVVGGIVTSVCRYDDGSAVTTESFMHPVLPLYGIRKKYTGIKGKRTVSLSYLFEIEDKNREKAVIATSEGTCPMGGRVCFTVFGQDLYHAEGRLISADKAKVTCKDRRTTLSFRIGEGSEITAWFLLCDDMPMQDPGITPDLITSRVKESGYDGLRAEAVQAAQEFFAKSYVKTDNERLDEIYKMSLYHLRAYTTRWSIPVGMYPEGWDGKFFAFDEYYNMLGLMGSGHFDLARRVPEFRTAVLNKAVFRATKSSETKENEGMARYVWQSSEYGEEIGSMGFWNDHVFHMAVIALGAYEYFEYTGDREALEKFYPTIRACAKFFTRFLLYRDEKRGLYVGKCTDLERLGAGVENPFMTSCGVIRTLQCLVAAADALGKDKEYRDECEALAAELYKTLPAEGDRYVPFLGCPQRSIAVFAGKYPFDVVDGKDEKLIRAFFDYMEHEEQYGNMYAVGKKVSPWYACWKAVGFARCGRGEDAYRNLIQSFESVGEFGEMFEINEPEKRYRPWFSTAAGVYLSTVNDMLVQTKGKRVDLCPAFPVEGKDLSFKLPLKGGAWIEAEIIGGEAKTIRILPEEKKDEYEVYFKDNICR